MRKLFSILSFVLLYMTFAYGQAAVDIPIGISDGGTNTINLAVGLDVTATDCIDPSLGESELPPDPPAGVFYAKLVLPASCGPLNGVANDYRGVAAFPFTGLIQHNLHIQRSTAGMDVDVIYNLPAEATMTIKDQVTGAIYNSGPLTGAGTFTITGLGASFSDFYVDMDYVNIGFAGGPEIAFVPDPLDFGSVAVGSPSTLPVQINNPGTEDLIISAVGTASDPQFVHDAVPVTIPAGGNATFNVTFTPTSLGAQSATIEFTSNSPSSPDFYTVQGTGADAGPTFSVSPGSLDFGNVGVGTSTDLTITVTNTGLINALNITDASTSGAPFSVAPVTAVIPAGGSQDFTVTFNPTAGGSYADDLTFLDDAPGSPHTVALAGNAVAVYGLIFEKDTVNQLEDASYTETMQLLGYTGSEKIKAIQFRLAVNKAGDDNTILTFQNIEKGANVAGSNWILDYNIFRGPITGNGASVDSIYVLLYNLTENGGLAAGDYQNLLTVKYRIANLPALVDSQKSSIMISHAEASTAEGFPIDITPSRNELVVWGLNRVNTQGDVNGDGCLDILDLIMVVDHIIGVDSLEGDYFTRADIAPWSPGAAEPSPDGFVNVQDLALIQNIILTGEYPDGTTINGCSYFAMGKIAGDVDAKVTFYVNSDGISAYLESRFDIRGAQVEFGNVINNPQNLQINTDLGQGYYLKTGELLRSVMYDRLGVKFIESGNHFMADMPFHINNPDEINLEKIILVNTDKQKLEKIQIEIVYGSAPSLPLDYVLYQNYPNPFNPTTTVRFQVPQTSDVTVKIYNTLGQEIRTLFSSQVQRGNYAVQWDGLNDAGVKMSSGTYIYRMTAGSFVQSKKMVLLK